MLNDKAFAKQTIMLGFNCSIITNITAIYKKK